MNVRVYSNESSYHHLITEISITFIAKSTRNKKFIYMNKWRSFLAKYKKFHLFRSYSRLKQSYFRQIDRLCVTVSVCLCVFALASLLSVCEQNKKKCLWQRRAEFILETYGARVRVSYSPASRNVLDVVPYTLTYHSFVERFFLLHHLVL